MARPRWWSPCNSWPWASASSPGCRQSYCTSRTTYFPLPKCPHRLLSSQILQRLVALPLSSGPFPSKPLILHQVSWKSFSLDSLSSLLLQCKLNWFYFYPGDVLTYNWHHNTLWSKHSKDFLPTLRIKSKFLTITHKAYLFWLLPTPSGMILPRLSFLYSGVKHTMKELC